MRSKCGAGRLKRGKSYVADYVSASDIKNAGVLKITGSDYDHRLMKRDCPTYNYWHDLRTDIRKPESWLDLTNMVLRRFRLVLVKTIDGEDVSWRLRGWRSFLDEIHGQGRCGACQE